MRNQRRWFVSLDSILKHAGIVAQESMNSSPPLHLNYVHSPSLAFYRERGYGDACVLSLFIRSW